MVKSGSVCSSLQEPVVLSGSKDLLFGLRGVVEGGGVEVAPAGEPFLAVLHAQAGDQPEAALGVREDPDHSRAALDFLVQPLQRIGGAQARAVVRRQRVDVEAGIDAVLEEFRDLGVGCALALGHLERQASGHVGGGSLERRSHVRHQSGAVLPSDPSSEVEESESEREKKKKKKKYAGWRRAGRRDRRSPPAARRAARARRPRNRSS